MLTREITDILHEYLGSAATEIGKKSTKLFFNYIMGNHGKIVAHINYLIVNINLIRKVKHYIYYLFLTLCKNNENS